MSDLVVLKHGCARREIAWKTVFSLVIEALQEDFNEGEGIQQCLSCPYVLFWWGFFVLLSGGARGLSSESFLFVFFFFSSLSFVS